MKLRNGKTRICDMLAGVLLAVLLTQIVLPAGAALAGKTIQVFTGVDIYVDDVKLEPKDANGNPVEVFVYNGTTYLPVRAVGEAVGKVIQWEGKTNSVYLGKHQGETPAVWLKDLDYFTGEPFYVWENEQDNVGGTYTYAFGGKDTTNVYLINGQYSKMTGTLFQAYEYRSYTRMDTTLSIYGDGELLFSGTVTGGVKPMDFSVDLTGVLELKVVWDGDNRARIGNCGLWT